jgi:hypothetical protein
MAKKFDRVGDFISDFRAKYQRSRKYYNLTIHKYKNLELIITQVGDKHDIKLFRDGADEVFSYWLGPDERRPIVADMMKHGMKQSLIAKMLKFSPGTINKDVQYMRYNTTMLDGVELRAPRKTYRSDFGLRVVTPGAGITLQ